MRREFKNSLLATVCIIAVLLLAAAVDLYRILLVDNVKEASQSNGVVKIYKEADYRQVCEIMAASGVLKNSKTFIRAAQILNLKVKFRPGYYVFHPGMDNREIIRTLAFGLQKPVKIVVPDNLSSLEQLSSVLAKQIDSDSASIAALLRDSTTAARYGFTAETFTSMFIPNTYEVYWTITPDNLLTRLFREYEKFWKDGRDEKAALLGLTRNEVSTLASIVMRETNKQDEMPVIAGVYLNRLKKNIPLQADPTVRFAVGDTVTRIKYSHLKFDSPYNTYLYSGLPPGPIAIPTVKSIDAVLNFLQHEYLYFCARPTFDGYHNFAKSLSAHTANAAEYHRALEVLLKRKKAVADSLARVEADSLAALAALETATSSQEGQSQESPSPSQEPKR